MRALFGILSTLILSFNSSAQADPGLDYVPPTCSTGIRSDSYGLGLYWGTLGNPAARSPETDSLCFDLGRARGKDLRADGCSAGEVHQGWEYGWTVTPTVGTACFSAGYAAGQAWLNFGARESRIGEAPEACVLLYRKGFLDARSGRVPEVSLSWSYQETHCFLLGHFEG